MNRLEFAASVISSLAWPATAVVLVVVLHRPIATALSNPAVKRWKVGPGGVEVENWDATVTEIRGEVVDAVEETAEDAPTTSLESAWKLGLAEELADLARVSPATTVLESFRRVESELRELAQGSIDEGHTVRRLPMVGLVKFSVNQGLITPETANAIAGLSVLRNLAAHDTAGSQLDTARALEFAALSDAVLFAIRNATRDQPDG